MYSNHPIMSMIITLVVFVSVVVFTTSPTNADLLYGEFDYSTFWYDFQIGSFTDNNQLGKILGENVITSQEFQFFCADFTRRNSNPFLEEYTGSSLANSTILSGTKKDALQSLFNHVYSPLLETNATFAGLNPAAPEWNTERDRVDVLNSALQIAVWEIIHESSDGNWDITNGSFMVYSPSSSGLYVSTLTPQQMYEAIIDLTKSWFASIKTGIWTGQFAEETFYELTYFTAVDDPSLQPLLLAVVNPSSNGVPEPATILLWTLGTLGAVGVSWTQRRTRRKNLVV